MKYLLVVTALLYNVLVFAQKPALDTGAFKKWAFLGGGSISADGNYISYQIYNQPLGSQTLVIQSKNGDWKKEVAGARDAEFIDDGRRIIFKIPGDTLCLLALGKNDLIPIPRIHESHLSKDGKAGWIAYRPTSMVKDLVLRSLADDKEQRFSSVTNYLFTDSGRSILLNTRIEKDSSIRSRLLWVSLSTGEKDTIWRSAANGQSVSDYSISPDGNKVAFLTEAKKDDHLLHELWVYKKDEHSLLKLADDPTQGVEAGLQISGQELEFSENGNDIFLQLIPVRIIKPKPRTVQVDVWSYTDKSLQSIQLAGKDQEVSYKAVYNTSEKKIIRLENDDERIIGQHGNVVLEEIPFVDFTAVMESGWNRTARPSYYLLSIKDGSRKLIRTGSVNPLGRAALSPHGRWVLYYNFKQKNYFSYEIATGITRNITKNCTAIWIDENNDLPVKKLPWVSWRDTWLQNDEAILIFDSYDIWQIDPAGSKSPINITNGYGRKNHIKFELVNEGAELGKLSLNKKSVIWLTSFDMRDKKRGFYSKILGDKGNPNLLTMEDFVFGDWSGYNSINILPLKAKNANTYLVRRMSAREAPNYFVTDNFVKFTALSKEQPQSEYNWMSTELIHWRTFDGQLAAGVLYKPENFDPSKKYPIIFDCYEKRSDELNLYIVPQFSEDRINIPWYVSNGYLVFTPDISYKIGEPGKSAYNSVVSAALYLRKKSWVDGKRMGIQGHSWGGYEANYIITHTDIFAAACSASGFCDLISWYGSAARGPYTIFSAENDQGRLGATPWQEQKKYLDNSPIFKADRVVTPLLMMNNKEDGTVPFSQGLEFFTSLRRLGKRVWMLQYDGEGHSLGGNETARDFSTRMAQFFDHYLKGKLPPKWMTRGISPKEKVIDNSLDLDKEILTPGPGLSGR